MRTLHLVESDTDAGRVVLATTDGLERFELPIDNALRTALADAPPIRATAAATTAATSATTGRSEPRISPREIQMRVRGGESPDALAETYDADPEWVLRFAGPVLAERTRIADEARRGKARRPSSEGPPVVFGETVDARFAAHGIDPVAVTWDAHRREDGQWVLRATWIGGQAERQADWAFHLSARTVTPLDDTAADLLSDRPIRPMPAPVPAESDTEITSPSLTIAPPLAPGVVAFPVLPDTHTGPLPHADEVFDQAGFEEPHLPMHVPDAPPAPPAPPARERRLTDLGVARRDDETDEDKAARASIPSWDDILLGVRRKRD